MACVLFVSHFLTAEGQKGQKLVTKSETTRAQSAADQQRVWDRSEPIGWNALPLSSSSQTKTGTQLAQCVLRLIDLPAMSSCVTLKAY